ncbi:MAG: ribosomal protein L13e [Candidatus Bathyarchaeia archaeon]
MMSHALKPKVYKKDGKQRFGKGFSREELKKAGLTLKEALKLHIPIDSRRKTAHDENVEAIKTFLKNKNAKAKSKGKSKR